ncbi:MAG: GIY-YIG nuclease family protein, partial [Patescibacteria group bacterium]|nr:GIY-YIG nuclease family protein [Patescibacteria group bacterium]
MHYVYILLLNNLQIYTGCTSNLKRRVEEHKLGKSKFTSKRL